MDTRQCFKSLIGHNRGGVLGMQGRVVGPWLYLLVQPVNKSGTMKVGVRYSQAGRYLIPLESCFNSRKLP